MRISWLAVAAPSAALVIAACSYSYSNPAERLRPGQVSGRVVSDPLQRGVLAPAAGVAVSLQGGTFDQATHDTGRFALVPLPVGRHTLLFRQGPGLALARHVEVRLGRDGQPEGVSLGDVVLTPAASVAGTASEPLQDGVVVDEVDGWAGEVRGSAYRLDGLGLGPHALRIGLVDRDAAREWVGGPAGVTLGPDAAAAVTRLARVEVHEVGPGTGTLRLRVVSLHPDLAPAGAALTVTESLRGPVAGLPAPDAEGRLELVLPEGVYRIALAPPPALAAELPAPAPAVAVVIAGQAVDAGALYLVPAAVRDRAQLACQEAADCGAGSCQGGACLGWAPPQAGSAAAPLCPLRGDLCSPVAGTCAGTDGLPGACIGVGSEQACIPCGSSCTVDGVTVHQGLCP